MAKVTDKVLPYAAIITALTGGGYAFESRYATSGELQNLQATVELKADITQFDLVMTTIIRNEIRRMKRQSSIIRRHPVITDMQQYQLDELKADIEDLELQLTQ